MAPVYEAGVVLSQLRRGADSAEWLLEFGVALLEQSGNEVVGEMDSKAAGGGPLDVEGGVDFVVGGRGEKGSDGEEGENGVEKMVGEEEVVMAELEVVVGGKGRDLVADVEGVGSADEMKREVEQDVRDADGAEVDSNMGVGENEVDVVVMGEMETRAGRHVGMNELTNERLIQYIYDKGREGKGREGQARAGKNGEAGQSCW